jgi:hypothetical protein
MHFSQTKDVQNVGRQMVWSCTIVIRTKKRHIESGLGRESGEKKK